MAHFVKLLASSKVLGLPFAALAVVYGGGSYVIYRASRSITETVLQVDYKQASKVSQYN